MRKIKIRRVARAKAYQLINEYQINESEILFFNNNNKTKVNEEQKIELILMIKKDKLKTWKNFKGTQTVFRLF